MCLCVGLLIFFLVCFNMLCFEFRSQEKKTFPWLGVLLWEQTRSHVLTNWLHFKMYQENCLHCFMSRPELLAELQSSQRGLETK